MVIGHDQAGFVINHTGAVTPFRQLHPVKEIAHIGFVGNTHHSGANLSGSLHDRRIPGTGHLFVDFFRFLFLLLLRRSRFCRLRRRFLRFRSDRVAFSTAATAQQHAHCQQQAYGYTACLIQKCSAHDNPPILYFSPLRPVK